MGGNTPDGYFSGEKSMKASYLMFLMGPLYYFILHKIFSKYYVVAFRNEVILLISTNRKLTKFKDNPVSIHKSEIVEAKGWKHGKSHNYKIKLQNGQTITFTAERDDAGSVVRFDEFLNIIHPLYVRDANAVRPWQGTLLSVVLGAVSVLIFGSLLYSLVQVYDSARPFHIFVLLAVVFFLVLALKVYKGSFGAVKIAITVSIISALVLGSAIRDGSSFFIPPFVLGVLNAFVIYLGFACSRNGYYNLVKQDSHIQPKF